MKPPSRVFTVVLLAPTLALAQQDFKTPDTKDLKMRTDSPPAVSSTKADTGNASLAALAAPLGRWIGTAVGAQELGDAAYTAVLRREFDIVTPENEMKFAPVHPRAGTELGSYDFSRGDKIVDFAAPNMKVRGHTLVWHNQLPGWLTGGGFGPAELAGILQNHIEMVAGHFRGKVYSWDVVNEAVAEDGSLRQTLWSSIGPDYIADAFRWAHAADPGAKLFYNDYGLESNSVKADAVIKLLSNLKAAGVPIDGVGLQMHLSLGVRPDGFAALIQSFADMGLEVHITELDVAVPPPATDAKLSAQADLYAQTLRACLSVSACKAFVMWGFSDAHSWKFQQTPDIFGADYQPKPAYGALSQVLIDGSP